MAANRLHVIPKLRGASQPCSRSTIISIISRGSPGSVSRGHATPALRQHACSSGTQNASVTPKNSDNRSSTVLVPWNRSSLATDKAAAEGPPVSPTSMHDDVMTEVDTKTPTPAPASSSTERLYLEDELATGSKPIDSIAAATMTRTTLASLPDALWTLVGRFSAARRGDARRRPSDAPTGDETGRDVTQTMSFCTTPSDCNDVSASVCPTGGTSGELPSDRSNPAVSGRVSPLAEPPRTANFRSRSVAPCTPPAPPDSSTDDTNSDPPLARAPRPAAYRMRSFIPWIFLQGHRHRRRGRLESRVSRTPASHAHHSIHTYIVSRKCHSH